MSDAGRPATGGPSVEAVEAALRRRGRRLVGGTARRLAGWAGVPAVVAAFWDLRIGAGLVAGALLGLLHVALLARQTARLAAAAAAGRRPAGRAGNMLFFGLKWPLWALALGGVLWYMRARPEPVAVGLVLALAAFAATARRTPS